MVGREFGNAGCCALLSLAGCASGTYEPCPVAWRGPLPADAFVRCRDTLLRSYSGLAVAEVEPLRLQTAWTATQDPPGERRAAVFVDDRTDPPGLAVVVELRWLRESWLGVPDWSAPRGDDAAERELAVALAVALEVSR